MSKKSGCNRGVLNKFVNLKLNIPFDIALMHSSQNLKHFSQSFSIFKFFAGNLKTSSQEALTSFSICLTFDNYESAETVKTENEMFGTLRTETRSPNVFLILLHKYKIQKKKNTTGKSSDQQFII